MQSFPPEVVDAVLRHMNSDHTDDNLVIVRANGAPDAAAATMTALDADGGMWSVSTADSATAIELRIPWTIPVAERADIRKAVVLLYRSACRTLGIEPRSE
ncbi:DUF2470 domain-containing protein [Leifsonia sp. NPDC102414]|uniref:DUF2470 domain-containing protein n=1 Tax=Leifsonia sp. NPDC102414 TaxID=3364124 RepID=UPI00381D0FDF